MKAERKTESAFVPVILTLESQANAQLKTEASTDQQKWAIFKAWEEYHYSGESFGKAQSTKPTLETLKP